MIAFNKPYYDKTETKTVADALNNGTDYLAKAEQELKTYFKDAHLFLTISGSAALEMIIAAIKIKPGDEVLMPAFNFPSAPNAVLRAGGLPVFVDINANTLAIDIEDIKRKTSSKTKCIITVSYGGATCDIEALNAFAKPKGIVVVEDAALSFGATYNNKPLGTLADFGMISFDKTKNISCEKGGLLIVNTKSDRVQKLEYIYNNGTDKVAFMRGDVEQYSWQNVGMNVGMSNLCASLLYAQLQKAEEILQRRKTIYNVYIDMLKDNTEEKAYRLPCIPANCTNNYHVCYVLFSSNTVRERIKKQLNKLGISAVTHYQPLHLSRMGQKLGYKKSDLPVTEQVCETILRLPMHANLSGCDAQTVAKALLGAL